MDKHEREVESAELSIWFFCGILMLAYGVTLVKGETACTSFEFGVVCANSKGHGFFLSRAVVRYF